MCSVGVACRHSPVACMRPAAAAVARLRSPAPARGPAPRPAAPGPSTPRAPGRGATRIGPAPAGTTAAPQATRGARDRTRRNAARAGGSGVRAQARLRSRGSRHATAVLTRERLPSAELRPRAGERMPGTAGPARRSACGTEQPERQLDEPRPPCARSRLPPAPCATAASRSAARSRCCSCGRRRAVAGLDALAGLRHRHPEQAQAAHGGALVTGTDVLGGRRLAAARRRAQLHPRGRDRGRHRPRRRHRARAARIGQARLGRGGDHARRRLRLAFPAIPRRS